MAKYSHVNNDDGPDTLLLITIRDIDDVCCYICALFLEVRVHFLGDTLLLITIRCILGDFDDDDAVLVVVWVGFTFSVTCSCCGHLLRCSVLLLPDDVCC